MDPVTAVNTSILLLLIEFLSLAVAAVLYSAWALVELFVGVYCLRYQADFVVVNKLSCPAATKVKLRE